jgi:tartrate-resistant acid phosphatase type 5
MMPPYPLSRREIVVGLPLVALAGAIPGLPRAEDADLNFLAVGDWGRDGASHQRAVAEQMGRAAVEVNSRFVASVGDNFYSSGVQTAQDPQWRTSFEDIYTAPGLQTPWYALLGNHDYRGVPQAQIDYAATSDRWRMPSRYYKVAGSDVGAAHVDLFFIDTSPMVHKYRDKVEGAIAGNVASQDVTAQLAWLDRELDRSTAPWKLVFGHHTIFSGSPEHGDTPELIERVRPLLERHGVQAYINGHEHDLQHIRVGSVDYICTGAGSEVRPTGERDGTLFALARSGFAVFTVGRDAANLAFQDFNGATVYQASLVRTRASQRRK